MKRRSRQVQGTQPKKKGRRASRNSPTKPQDFCGPEATLMGVLKEAKLMIIDKIKYCTDEDLYACHSMLMCGMLSREDVKLFCEMYAPKFRCFPEKNAKMKECKDLAMELGYTYISTLKKNELLALLKPYEDSLQYMSPRAISAVKRYQKYVDDRTAVENVVGPMARSVTYDMYMMNYVDRDEMMAILGENGIHQWSDSVYQIFLLLVSFVRDPEREITTSACKTLLLLTDGDLLHVRDYRQLPSQAKYRGWKGASIGVLEYPSSGRYPTSSNPPLRMYKLSSIVKCLVEKHGGWREFLQFCVDTEQKKMRN